VPQEWYDLYPLDTIQLAPSRLPPIGVPTVAMNDILNGYWSNSFSDFASLRANGSITAGNPYDNSTLPGYWARRARQAYWAATSFTDDNFGQVISAAKATGLYDRAVVIAWGDHGYQLGDNDQWSKVTNFEQATRIPLMIKYPGGRSGGRTSALVEAVDLMPTTVQLAFGLMMPTCPRNVPASRATWLCTDGTSRATEVTGPSPPMPANASAFSQVPRGKLVDGEPGDVAGESYMGYTLRQEGWRYTEWIAFDPDLGKGNWSNVVGVELYQHSEAVGPTCDFGTETVNAADDVANQAVRKAMSARLRAQFDISW